MQSHLQFLSTVDFKTCLIKDRFAFSRRYHALKKRVQKKLPAEDGLFKLVKEIKASQAIVQLRQKNSPTIDYPSALPVSDKIKDISELIQHHQVVIFCGETGSGKSTQLPKICLQLGYGIYGRIAHTQPRRIAARSLANRISSELKSETGELVGYKVRFKDRVNPQTSIKLLTDGMLLAESQTDTGLNEYDCIIIDEAHERSLNIDFLLGSLKHLLTKRPDLKLIITSATINPQQFSEFYQQAPIINVSGRTFPVEVLYRPLEAELSDKEENLQTDYLSGIEAAVKELSKIGRGDILVFLSGEREIRDATDYLTRCHFSATEVLPLFARLSPQDQAKIFKSSGLRRIILATNVAETSLTIPNIHYVIDAGLARISRYSYRSKIQRLPIERVSQASANQRKGRCGRIAKGVCIRLYSEEDFLQRAEFSEPEIQRTNLASVILQMKLLGFGDIDAFPFIDPPDRRLIKDGYQVLTEISAVDGLKKITQLGRQCAKLPVDPRIARMLIEATQQGCLKECLVICAALSVQDPRDRPFEHQKLADQAHALFRHPDSDFYSFWLLWQQCQSQRKALTRHKWMRWCRAHFLSALRIQEWMDIHYQLASQMKEMKYRENTTEASIESIHQALLSGLLSHIGFKSKESHYQGTRNRQFWLFPGSALFKVKPKWVMSAELVETSKLYARTNAKIDPRWIEPMAGHLVRRTYASPHWEKNRGQVAGKEQVTLFGLVIVPWRKINYGPLFPTESRDIFIRFALVEAEFETKAPFWRHNLDLIQSLRDEEAKTRRHDILVDEELIYEFYQTRIPEGIYNKPLFEKWCRKATQKQPKLLHMRLADLKKKTDNTLNQTDFPDQLTLGDLCLPLKYVFEPTNPNDGINLDVPLALINQVSATRGEWLVPGLLRERVIALIKSLPKSIRKSFVPAPNYADQALKLMQASDTPLKLALAQALKEITGIQISETDWQEHLLPPHLQLNYRILDEKGKLLDSGRDLAPLRKKYADRASQSFQKLPTWQQEIKEVTAWDFGDLPDTVDIQQGGIRLKGYPALVATQRQITLKLVDSLEKAKKAHRQGVRQLIINTQGKKIRYLRKSFPNLTPMRLQYTKVPTSKHALTLDLEQELILLSIDRCFFQEGIPRQQAQYEQLLAQYLPELINIANEVCQQTQAILNAYQKVRQALSKINTLNLLPAVQDMQQQLNNLVYQGFLTTIDPHFLSQYPRYLNAMQTRITRLKQNPNRDQQQLQSLKPLLSQWQQRMQQCNKKGQSDPRLNEMALWFEELRVSFFAQELKTAFPVSIKRLEKKWQELGL